MFGYVDIDREITGNYGEDSCGEEVVACTCDECNEPKALRAIEKVLKENGRD